MPNNQIDQQQKLLNEIAFWNEQIKKNISLDIISEIIAKTMRDPAIIRYIVNNLELPESTNREELKEHTIENSFKAHIKFLVKEKHDTHSLDKVVNGLGLSEQKTEKLKEYASDKIQTLLLQNRMEEHLRDIQKENQRQIQENRNRQIQKATVDYIKKIQTEPNEIENFLSEAKKTSTEKNSSNQKKVNKETYNFDLHQ
ncbi:hypothetical protein NXO50_000117 [Enterococcus hirae]|nr:hypothetical protein [Enterococcus hirae]EMF0190872.1 hypothetical protein [Enterococcus hirae]EMF0239643.1 hypothetical protein [Enterococcus hirae]EMF0244235.1 hypothetical protein [Enterococcus hirae]